jgi:membrane associated rhomboid family serine protease
MSDPATPRWSGTPQAPLSDLTRSGPLDPAVAVGLLQRAQTLAEQGDWDLAAGTFARVVGNGDPNLHVAALLGLAESRYRMDDEAGALQAWITATQAPETELTWRAWKALAAARVREGDMAGASRAYREAERRAPVSERPEIASRLGWLAKESGNTGAAERYFRRSRTGLAPTPIVTYAILAVTVAVGLAQILGVSARWEELLYLDKHAVNNDGEYWRLITVVLVHGGILHLAFNMYALFAIGPVCEALYGPWRFLFIYLACGAAASAVSFAFGYSGVPSVGASGAIFGLFGLLLVADRVHKPALTRNARSLTMQIGVLIVINLVIGFAAGGQIDNLAHIGGLLAGAWLGFVMVPVGATTLRSLWSGGPEPRKGFDPTRLVRLLGVVALLAVVAGLAVLGPFMSIRFGQPSYEVPSGASGAATMPSR